MAHIGLSLRGRRWLVEVRDMMFGYDAGGFGGWWMLAGMAIFAFAVLGSVWLIVRRPTTSGASRSTAEEILRERFDRGELSGEQFDEAKRRLS
jgi:uncharacterized membrane protein